MNRTGYLPGPFRLSGTMRYAIGTTDCLIQTQQDCQDTILGGLSNLGQPNQNWPDGYPLCTPNRICDAGA